VTDEQKSGQSLPQVGPASADVTGFVWRRGLTELASAMYLENSKLKRPHTPIDADDPVVAANLRAIDRHTLVLEEIVSRGGKRYESVSSVALDEPDLTHIDLAEALASRRSVRRFAPGPVEADTLAAMLGIGYGANATDPDRRYVPSAGALYPCEIYLAAIEETPPLEGTTLYHYRSCDHRVERLRSFEHEELLALFTPPNRFSNSAAVVFVTGAIPRLSWKYGECALRYALLEVGHIVQTMCLVAVAERISACPVVGFYDDAVHDFMDIDGTSEVVLCSVFLGRELGHSEDER